MIIERMRYLRLLPVLLVVLSLSFTVRLVSFTNGVIHGPLPALAQQIEEPGDKVPAKADPMTAQDSDERSALDRPDTSNAEPAQNWRDSGDTVFDYSGVRNELYEDLVTRRQNLDKREKELAAREALLKAAEMELERKFSELQQLRGEIQAFLEQQEQNEDERIQSLVKVYEGMKAKDAAQIFETLDLSVLTEVMSRMSERKISPILAEMSPERARTITTLLLQETQLPTTVDPNFLLQ